MQTTKTFATGSITLKTGTEGPRHDPYGYSEWIFVRRGKKAILHEGLSEWVSIDGQKNTNREICLMEGKDSEIAARLMFEKEVGVSLKTLEKVIHRPKRCCNKPRITSSPGYPGETLYICANCENIVGGSFNEAAVI